jgi:hypothetical protein
MKRFWAVLFLLLSATAFGYEFEVDGTLTPILRPAPKQLLDARSMPTAVLHVLTDIKGVQNCGNFCVEQEETSDGYYFYVVANEPVRLRLAAPQFTPLDVSFKDRLSGNEVRQLKINRAGKDPSSFHVNWDDPSSIYFYCEEDPSNLASSLYEKLRGAPQVWVYTDLPFSEIEPMFNKEAYELVSSPSVSPYRLVIKQKNVDEPVPFERLFSSRIYKKKSIKFLRADSPIQKGDMLVPFATYRLNLYWN